MSKKKIDSNAVLIKTFNNSCKSLGLSTQQATDILGIAPESLKDKKEGFALKSKTNELCLLLIQIYRSLFSIAGGDQAFMRHWLNTENSALNAKPATLLSNITGLVRVNMYLDAMRKA